MDAMAMLEDSVQRKLEQERASDGKWPVTRSVDDTKTPTESTAGLVVISAHYGLTSAFTPLGMREKEGEEKVADVTIAVQALVQNGHLHIPAGRPKVSEQTLMPSSLLTTVLASQYNILGFYVSAVCRMRQGASADLDSDRTLAWVKLRVCEFSTCSETSCTRSRWMIWKRCGLR